MILHLGLEGKNEILISLPFPAEPTNITASRDSQRIQNVCLVGYIWTKTSLLGLCIPKHLCLVSSCFQSLALGCTLFTHMQLCHREGLNKLQHCHGTVQVLQNMPILRLMNLRTLGCSDAIQLSLTHQVCPSRVNLLQSPGIFLSGTSLKECFNSRKTTPKSKTKQYSTPVKNLSKWHRWHPSYHEVFSIMDANMAFTHAPSFSAIPV